jgi:hypothetical protein
MHESEDGANEGRPLVSNRTMEIVVALFLLAGCAIVIFDSLRLGAGWREGEGPGPGYFPFYVSVILGVASLVNLVNALRGLGRGEVFVAAWPFARVLAVLIPSLVFVALIGGLSIGPVDVPGLGIYVSSDIFLFFFMVTIGRESILRAVVVSAVVPFSLFLMFEKWFLVPLPKGPLEAWLGY